MLKTDVVFENEPRKCLLKEIELYSDNKHCTKKHNAIAKRIPCRKVCSIAHTFTADIFRWDSNYKAS